MSNLEGIKTAKMISFTLISYLEFSCVFVKNHAADGVSVHYLSVSSKKRLVSPYLWLVVWNELQKRESGGIALEEALNRRILIASGRVYFFNRSFG
jgi:hypothetical protein